jgi:hypothetical protein
MHVKLVTLQMNLNACHALQELPVELLQLFALLALLEHMLILKALQTVNHARLDTSALLTSLHALPVKLDTFPTELAARHALLESPVPKDQLNVRHALLEHPQATLDRQTALLAEQAQSVPLTPPLVLAALLELTQISTNVLHVQLEPTVA